MTRDAGRRTGPAGRRVLVTGGAGFVGSHVCEAYRDEGWEVVALDDLSSGRRSNVPEGVELVEMDVRDAELPALVAGRGFDVVNHHAAQIDVRRSVEDPRFDASVNVDGLLNLLEAAVAADVERMVFASSGGVVYGEPEAVPAPEEHPKRPASPYGVTKLAAEHYLHCYRHLHGLEVVSLRYANVYGPRQDPHGEAGVVAIFGGRLLEDEPLTIFGDGTQTRDYVFAGDVARANLWLTDAELATAPSGPDDLAYNVGTGRETSVDELADLMERVTGARPDREYASARPGELARSALDPSRLRALGWRPRVDLEEGLRRTVEAIARREDREA